MVFPMNKYEKEVKVVTLYNCMSAINKNFRTASSFALLLTASRCIVKAGLCNYGEIRH